jgi:hypothetical protein
MADGVQITAGSGTTIATDDIGGIQYQIVKAAFGALDTATLVSTANPLPVTAPSALTVTATLVATSGGYVVKTQRSSTNTNTSVASSASSVTLLAANSSRLGATIYNDSTQILFVAFTGTASATAYVVQMASGAYYEVPTDWTGIITGIWASANGNARINERT